MYIEDGLKNRILSAKWVIYRWNIGDKSRVELTRGAAGGGFQKISPIFRYFIGIFTDFSGNFPIFPTSPARAQDTKSVQFFFKKKYQCYLVIWSWCAGKGCVFQPASKIVDLGFVKFKSNGTTAKRPLKQIQKTQGAKDKQFFFLFSLGVLHGFSRKSNEDEFSRKSNGGWMFLGIKRGGRKIK